MIRIPNLLAFGLCIAFAPSIPSAQEPSDSVPEDAERSGYTDIIESLEDVLPPEIAATLGPDLDRRLVGGLPIFLLVNPLLKGDAQVPLTRTLALEGMSPLAPDVLAILGAPADGREAPIYWQLERVFRDYLRLVFSKVEEGDDLQALVQHKREPRMLVVTIDAQAGLGGEQGRELAVKIAMRLWRIELRSTPPYPVKSAEMLYSDRAVGRAPLPAPGPGGYSERLLFAAFRGAVIDAIKDQLAMSLWGNPLMVSTAWTEIRTDPIGAATSRPAPPPGAAPVDEGASPAGGNSTSRNVSAGGSSQ